MRKEKNMIKCVIKYDIDKKRKELLEKYESNWGEWRKRWGEEMIGYYEKNEG